MERLEEVSLAGEERLASASGWDGGGREVKLLEGGSGEAAAEEAAIVERLEAGGRRVLTLLLDMVGIVDMVGIIDIVGIVEEEEVEGSPM